MSNAENTITRLMAQSLIDWVQAGNWLGASWPSYVPGFRYATQAECDTALNRAEEMVPDLLWQAQLNFQRAAEAE